MFSWLRYVWIRRPLPQPAEASAANAPVAQAPGDSSRESSHRRVNAARSSSSTRVIRARLSPELSQLAAAHTIETFVLEAADEKSVSTPRSRRRTLRLRRFARRFTAMTLCEARLLVAVHRGSLRAVAADNAGQLHSDIQRFLLSTRGQTAFNGKNAPGIEKIRQWVTEARQISRTQVIDPVR